MPDSDFLAALRALCEGGVEFVIVGGIAAVLNGAPVTTFDLAIVPQRNGENIAKLLNVLNNIGATYRMHPNRDLKPGAGHLSSPGHHNLITRCGPLDVLGTISRGMGYDDLLPHTVEMELGRGTRVRVLDLATIAPDATHPTRNNRSARYSASIGQHSSGRGRFTPGIPAIGRHVTTRSVHWPRMRRRPCTDPAGARLRMVV